MGVIQRQSALSALAAYAGSALAFVNKALLFTNLLTTEQVGLANALGEIAIIYMHIAVLGLPWTVLRFFPYFKGKDKEDHGFLAFIFWISVGGFLLVSLLLLAGQPVLEGWFRAKSPLLLDYLPGLIVMSLGVTLYDTLSYYLRSYYKVFVPTLVKELGIRLIQTIGLVLFGLKWISFERFMEVYIGSFVVATLVLLLYMAWMRRLNLRWRMTWRLRKLMRAMLEHGGYSALSITSIKLVQSLDILMIASIIGLGDEGIYATMMYFVSFMLLPIRSFHSAASPQVAENWHKNDMEAMNKLYKRVSLTGIAVGLWVFFCLWINFHNFVTVMQPAYAAGKWAFLFVAIARLFDILTSLNGHILVTSRFYRIELLFNASLLVLAFVTNYFFIRWYGITGAAIASMISVVGFNITRMSYVWYKFRLHPFTWQGFSVIGLGLLAWLSDWLIPQMPHFLIDMVVRCSVYSVLFLGSLLALRLVPDLNRMFDQGVAMLALLAGGKWRR